MKIAFINYYLRTKDYPTRYSLATLRICEYVSSYGYDIDIIPLSLSEDKLDEFINNNLEKYNVIGISHYVWSKNVTPILSSKIRKKFPDKKIIIGGPEVLYVELEQYEKEIFILGEGENSFLKVLEHISGIDNLSDERFYTNNLGIFDKKYPIASLNEIPLCYANPLFTKFVDIDKDFLYYETSRGCLYKCGYCGFRNREEIVNFPLEFVKEEIKRIGKLKFKEVFIVDANLGGTKERAKKILYYFQKYANDSKLTFYLRPEFVDDEMIELLESTNIKDLRIGIQTTNPKVPLWLRSNALYFINNQLPKLSLNKVRWKAELIIGLPNDDIYGLTESINFVENILQPTEYCCYPLTAIKGTPLYELIDKFEDNIWIKVDEYGRVVESLSYSKDELLYMQEYAKKRMNEYIEKNNNIVYSEKVKIIKRNNITYKSID